ncbi:hypothetical protein IX317_002134 [Fusobacterium sp. DD29]|uniref:Sak single strand annealing protein n=1 Tax=unclassified Fusobacterium TaxID=2648384 RepID=UPI001B8ACD18|nr:MULTISPECIES: DUF1071 domain-containing protein [unclassified Fusobacterium]MBR8750412.1 hypothetical protein [Fusobacterium sp. DD29]MBR8762653.1 hypothetical protein [Fusobacterium sp. DD25]MBR8768690.1 hypothetical protein [Fusobacterium sp. DD43]MBR8772763.1 hypothetical protein [Fusobacterium sp. DD40]MBR8776972.1 hypothetical protein [Fusobacterium sp. DD17]
MTLEKFDELYKIDLQNKIEQDYKGLNYLSWATAYKLAMEKDPTMKYEILEDQDGIPFFSRGKVHIVKTIVTMFGESKAMILPIMDNKHNAVDTPNARQVNDNIMRCLAKNIAMFGIGLPLYVGEDLKQFDEDQPVKQPDKPSKSSKSKEVNKKDLDKAATDSLRTEIVKTLTEADDPLLEKMLGYLKKKNLGECNYKDLKMIKGRLEEERKKAKAIDNIGKDEIGGIFQQPVN